MATIIPEISEQEQENIFKAQDSLNKINDLLQRVDISSYNSNSTGVFKLEDIEELKKYAEAYKTIIELYLFPYKQQIQEQENSASLKF